MATKSGVAVALTVVAVFFGVGIVAIAAASPAGGTPPDDDPDPDDPDAPDLPSPSGPIISAEPDLPPSPSGPIIGVEPVPQVPVIPSVEIPQFELADTFRPSKFQCKRTDQSFNLDDWGSPAKVAAAFRFLGFSNIQESDILQADKVRAKSRRLYDAPVKKKRSKKLKVVQAIFRSLGLPSHVNAKDVNIDGIPGECTLGDLTVAVKMANAGVWSIPE